MSEKYVAEYVEILDDNGERKGVCVTDTEHTVSFEVKDEYVAMELCDLLNKLYEENDRLKEENRELRKQVEEYEMILRQHESAEYINKLQEEIGFWKKWALEYLTNYDIYTDEFLEILEFLEGEETVQRIRERQNEIIKILKKEELL